MVAMAFHVVGEAAQARAQHDATFGRKPAAPFAVNVEAITHSWLGEMVRAERHRQELPRVTVRCKPSGPQRWIGRSSRRELAQLLAAATAGRDDLGAGPDHDALEDALLARRHQGRDGARLGTQALG